MRRKHREDKLVQVSSNPDSWATTITEFSCELILAIKNVPQTCGIKRRRVIVWRAFLFDGFVHWKFGSDHRRWWPRAVFKCPEWGHSSRWESCHYILWGIGVSEFQGTGGSVCTTKKRVKWSPVWRTGVQEGNRWYPLYHTGRPIISVSSDMKGRSTISYRTENVHWPSVIRSKTKHSQIPNTLDGLSNLIILSIRANPICIYALGL